MHDLKHSYTAIKDSERAERPFLKIFFYFMRMLFFIKPDWDTFK